MKPRRLPALALLPVLAFGAHAAQDGGDEPPVSPDPLFPQDDPQAELVRLFHEVESALSRIDVTLTDAAAGDVSLAEVEDAGIDELLRGASSSSRSVVAGIDRILEIAESMGGGPSMSQPSGKPDQGQPSGQEKPGDSREDGESPRERTPDAPQPKPGEDSEQPGGGDEPNSNREDTPDEGRNDVGSQRKPNGDAPPSTSDDADAWGHLPTRTREIFRNQGRDDLPVRYRDWIDSYYRRLSRER